MSRLRICADGIDVLVQSFARDEKLCTSLQLIEIRFRAASAAALLVAVSLYFPCT